jgi:hypothetical protein
MKQGLFDRSHSRSPTLAGRLVAYCVIGATAMPQTGVHFAEMKTSQTSVLLQTGGQGLAPAVGIE